MTSRPFNALRVVLSLAKATERGRTQALFKARTRPRLDEIIRFSANSSPNTSCP